MEPLAPCLVSRVMIKNCSRFKSDGYNLIPHGSIITDRGLSSHGSYFRFDDGEVKFAEYLKSISRIDSFIVRVGVGLRTLDSCSKSDFLYIVRQIRIAADLAYVKGLKLAFEIYADSFTNINRSSAKYIQYINHNNVFFINHLQPV